MKRKYKSHIKSRPKLSKVEVAEIAQHLATRENLYGIKPVKIGYHKGDRRGKGRAHRELEMHLGSWDIEIVLQYYNGYLVSIDDSAFFHYINLLSSGKKIEAEHFGNSVYFVCQLSGEITKVKHLEPHGDILASKSAIRKFSNRVLRAFDLTLEREEKARIRHQRKIAKQKAKIEKRIQELQELRDNRQEKRHVESPMKMILQSLGYEDENDPRIGQDPRVRELIDNLTIPSNPNKERDRIHREQLSQAKHEMRLAKREILIDAMRTPEAMDLILSSNPTDLDLADLEYRQKHGIRRDYE